MHKRILSIVLCLAMMMSFAVPAYATDGNAASDDIFIADDVIVSDGEITTSFDEDGNIVIKTEPKQEAEVNETTDETAEAVETEAPVEESEASAEETEAPAEETEASVEETEAPAEETEAPVEETEAPVEKTEAPIEESEITETETAANATSYPGLYVVAEDGTYNGSINYNYGDLSGGDGVVTILLDGDGCPAINGVKPAASAWPNSNTSWVTNERRLMVSGSGVLYMELQHKDLYGTGKTTSTVNNLVWDLMQIRVTGGATLVIRLGGSFEGDETITLRYKKNDNSGKPFDVFPMFDVADGNLLIRWSNISTLPTDLGVATNKASFFAHTADDWTDSGKNYVPMIIDGQDLATNIQPESKKDHPLILLRSTSGTARNFFIEDVQFKNAKYRAIRCYANEMANLVVKDCTFDNTVRVDYTGSENGGAAINIEANQLWSGAGTNLTDVAEFVVDHCKFDGSVGNDDGGAIESLARINKTEIKNSKFLNMNTTQKSSAGVDSYAAHGGAIAFKGYMNTILFDNVEFNNIVVKEYGGAVFFESAKNSSNDWSKFNSITFQDCTFKDCVSRKQHGGAIATLAQIHTMKVLGCKFEGCKSLANGAAISINGKALADFNDWQATFPNQELNNTFKYQFASGGNDYSSVDTLLIDAYNGKQTQFIDCKASTSGGAIEVAQNTYVKDMDILNTLIQGCKAVNNGAAIFLSSPVVESLNIENTTVTQCGYIKGIPDGNGFQKDANGQYIDDPDNKDATLIAGGDAGGVIRSTGATTCILTMKNCRVTDNYSYSNGGGLYWNACYNRGILKECYATVTDCTFSGNYCEESGGGIYCESKLTVSGCKIFNNYAKCYGGGIAQQVYSNSGRMLQKGEQTNLTINSYTNPDTNAVITTEIYNNYSDRYGGGVSVRANPTKSIQASNATVGHAVILNLNDAIIRNNTAKSDGGGIYFVELRDYPGYYDTDSEGKDIKIPDEESIIKNNKELDTYVKSITITGAHVYENRSGIAQDWSTSAKTESLNGGNGGGIYMSASNQTTLNINSGDIHSNTATKGNGGGIYMAGKNAVCNVSGGTIGGADSVTYNEDGTVNTITGATPNYATRADNVGGNGGGIAISGGARIEMSGGEISHNVVKHHVKPAKAENETNCTGGGIWLDKHREVKLDDGTIVRDQQNSMLMTNGTVCHNSTPGNTDCHGGGIWAGDYSSFQIDNGYINYNYAGSSAGGGLVSTAGARVIVNGGEITHNIAADGAGMQNWNGFTDINGGTIAHNIASKNGGAIWAAYATVNVYGGLIQDNSALLGGGIFGGGSWGTINVYGGEVKKNAANIAGGGLFVTDGSKINVLKYTNTETNKTTYGTITENTAPLGGGLAVFNGGQLEVTGGYITYNKATGTPGQTTSMINILDNKGAFPSVENLHLKGVGGGIFVADGQSDEKPSKFTLTVQADSHVAIYANLADFGADDVFANSNHTKLSIPSTVDMDLGGYGLPVMGWFEDYPNEDTSYTSGLKSAPNGVTPYVNGIADGYFASNENVRYRNVDAAKRREVPYKTTDTVTSYAPNQANEYVCLTLGIPAALDDVVVIDFGLPVDINVIANDAYLQGAKLEAIGLKRPATANAFTEELESAPTWTYLENGGNFNSKYFSAVRKGNTNNITFTPMKMDVKDPMEFAYAVSHNFKGGNDVEKTFYFYANVTVIPATNIYFEDSFVKFTNAKGATSASGVWTQDGTTILKNQETDAPGPNADADRPELDADNIYGYDDAYANCTTYSLGSAHKVTVDATTGTKDNAPKATFSFTGTGFDVVSLTNNDSGCLWVKVTDAAGKQVRSYVVSNYYGYKYGLCNVHYTYDGEKWNRAVGELATNASAVQYADVEYEGITKTGIERIDGVLYHVSYKYTNGAWTLIVGDKAASNAVESPVDVPYEGKTKTGIESFDKVLYHVTYEYRNGEWIQIKGEKAADGSIESPVDVPYEGKTKTGIEKIDGTLHYVTYTFSDGKWRRTVNKAAPANASEDPVDVPHVGKIKSGIEMDWGVDRTANNNSLYQVPVIKVDDLPYGTYDVEMKVVYLISQDIPANGQPGGSYTVWIDAIRVYNPRQGDATSENVYVQDGESNPLYLNISKNIASGFELSDFASGIGYVDGKDYGNSDNDKKAFLSEYTNAGPNNEAYLKYYDGFVFRLRYFGSKENSPAGGTFHIGAKLAAGEYATFAVSHKDSDGNFVLPHLGYAIKTSTNMYYKGSNLDWDYNDTLGCWESGPILVKHDMTYDAGTKTYKYDNSAILSLTDLKLCVPYAASGAEASEAKVEAFVDTEAVKFAEEIYKSEMAQNQKTINLAYPTLSFEDEIKYNFYYTVENLDVAVEDMGLITWSAKPEDATFAAAETVIPGAIYNAATGEYMVRTNGIPAKKLGDDVFFKVYAKLSDGTYAYSSLARYSAKYYAEDRLENSNSAAMKAACVAMLNYGAAAQMHFGYKTDALVNADLNAEQKALVSEYSADMINALPTVDAAKAGDFVANGGFTTGYPTVSFEGAFAINYYFVPNKTIDGDLTLYCWDLETYNSVDKLTADNATAKVAMTQTATGEYFGTYSGIAAKQIDETVFVACVYETDGVRYSTSVVPYSVGAYCVDKAANGSDTMKVFAAETAVFGHYAKIYFDNLQK